MKLAVVAYPKLPNADRRSIELLRAQYDPQASPIDVHFTLVFPFDGVPTDLGPELATVTQTAEPFSFAIREVKVVPDHLGIMSHVFLVPGEGKAEITALHGRLYAGSLRRHLRADIPFVPHMTIGADSDRQQAERLGDEIRAIAPTLRGEIVSLELINIDGPRVQTVAAYPLGRLD